MYRVQVFATNGPCEDNPAATCVKAVHLIYEKNVIHVTEDVATKKVTLKTADVGKNLPTYFPELSNLFVDLHAHLIYMLDIFVLDVFFKMLIKFMR